MRKKRVPRELMPKLVMLAGSIDRLKAVHEACLIGIDFGKRINQKKVK